MTSIKEARRILSESFHDKGAVSFYRGIFTIRESYFYRHGRTAEKLVAKILEALPEVKVIKSGDHYANFNKGVSLKRSSHLWVKVRLVGA